MVTAHIGSQVCHCGAAAVMDGLCDRHDGKRPSPTIVYLHGGRRCVIEETGGVMAKVRYLDGRPGVWPLTAFVERRMLVQVPR